MRFCEPMLRNSRYGKTKHTVFDARDSSIPKKSQATDFLLQATTPRSAIRPRSIPKIRSLPSISFCFAKRTIASPRGLAVVPAEPKILGAHRSRRRLSPAAGRRSKRQPVPERVVVSQSSPSHCRISASSPASPSRARTRFRGLWYKFHWRASAKTRMSSERTERC
jgi:hypothetical protein